MVPAAASMFEYGGDLLSCRRRFVVVGLGVFMRRAAWDPRRPMCEPGSACSSKLCVNGIRNRPKCYVVCIERAWALYLCLCYLTFAQPFAAH